MRQVGDRGLCGGAEMGASLPVVSLGPGRSAVAVSAGFAHTCVLLVRKGSSGSGLMMMRRKGRLGQSMSLHTDHSRTSTLTENSPAPVCEGVDRPAVFDACEPFVLAHM